MIVNGNSAVVTLATPGFRLGAAVTISSFLAAHPDFDGDVVVFESGLMEEDIVAFGQLGPQVTTRPIPRTLRMAVAALIARQPNRKATAARYFSGAVFSLAGYSRVLFLDADTLVRSRLDDLLKAGAPLTAAPDIATLRGDGPAPWRFNAGVLGFGAGGLGPKRLDEYLVHLHRQVEEPSQTPFHDQDILNAMYRDSTLPVSSAHNYLAAVTDLLQRQGTEPTDAAIVHFNGPFKPWIPVQSADLLSRHTSLRPVLAEWARHAASCIALGVRP